MSDDYEVGYGNPPKHTRFPKGQSGNPKGRPKGRRNFKTDVKATLEARTKAKGLNEVAAGGLRTGGRRGRTLAECRCHTLGGGG